MKTMLEQLRQNANYHPEDGGFYIDPPQFTTRMRWNEVWAQTQSLALGLQSLGITKNTCVGILAPSSANWEISNLAVQLTGGIVVGLDVNDSPQSYSDIINKCEINYFIVDQIKNLEKLNTVIKGRTNCKVIYWGKSNDAYTMAYDLLKKFKGQTWNLNLPQPQDPCTIIFTSGTTGQPKGILYTHEQLLLAAFSILRAFPSIQNGTRTFCWLPLSNLFQRMINLCSFIIHSEIYFVDKPSDVMLHINRVEPDIFVAVPAMLEKILTSIKQGIAKKGLIASSIFYLSFKVARWHSDNPSFLSRQLYFLFDKLILIKLRHIFGSRLKFIISGSAPARRELLEIYKSFGILILESYGTSENTVPLACNRLEDYRFGSVGKPLADNTIKISEQGEVLVKGMGLFTGYYKDPNRDMMSDGYYKTGDLGHFDQDGFLYLQGRISDTFKTSGGIKVPTIMLQNLYKQIPYIDTAIVMGEARHHPVILVTLDFSSLAATCGVNLESIWDATNGAFSSDTLYRLENDLRIKNLECPEKYRPCGILILPRKFSFEENEVTSSFKMRRKFIEQKFSKSLDAFYKGIDIKSGITPIWVLNPNQIETVDFKLGSKKEEKSNTTSLIKLIFRISGLYLRYSLNFKDKKSVWSYTGQALVEGLSHLKGPLRKLSSIVSYLNPEMPSEFKAEWREANYNTTPVNSQLIRSIVESELRAPIPSIFSSWNDHPLAVGSVAQVHLAQLHDNTRVIVKVVVPGIEKATQADLLIIRFILPFLKKAWRAATLSDVFEELKKLIMSEFDLLNECRNMQTFKRIFAANEKIIVPKVYPQLCTKNVLVAEYIPGLDFDDFKNTATQKEKNEAAAVIWQFHYESVHDHCIFNLDTDPSNLIFQNGKVAFVDYSLCKVWSPDFINQLKQQTLAGYTNDLNAFTAASIKLGIKRINSQFNYEELLIEYRQSPYAIWLNNQEITFTHNLVKKILKSIFKHQIGVPDIILPSEFLALSQIFFGKYIILAELKATVNFHQLTIPYLKKVVPADYNPLIGNDDKLTRAS